MDVVRVKLEPANLLLDTVSATNVRPEHLPNESVVPRVVLVLQELTARVAVLPPVHRALRMQSVPVLVSRANLALK